VASGYISGFKVGEKVQVTGPAGKAFLLPPNRSGDLLMFATGVGFAPFRGFMKARFDEQKGPLGETYLYAGYQTKKDALYEDEIAGYAGQPGFHYATALSREEPAIPKTYVQQRMIADGDNVLTSLQKPETNVYICGLSGMDTGIERSVLMMAEAKNEGLDLKNADVRKLLEAFRPVTDKSLVQFLKDAAGSQSGKPEDQALKTLAQTVLAGKGQPPATAIDGPGLMRQLKAEKRWHVEVF
jgi:ferredoxin--NADP+ reductase